MTPISPIGESKPTRWASGVRILAAIGLVAVVGTVTFADYLSSWLPKVGGFPAGAILRDGVAVSFICLAGAILFQERSGWSRASMVPLASGRSPGVAALAFLPFAALAAWVLMLVLPSPATVPAILAARNLLLYTMVGFAAYVLVARRSLSIGVLLGTLAAVGFIAAVLGILDTVTHGEVVASLGYRRDYSGVEGSAGRLIAGASAAFQGYVRASGGISNALVFGYLMAAFAVFATWMVERAVARSGWGSRAALTHLALGIVAGVACVASLTRGAMIALVFGLLVLVILRRSRPILVGAISTVALALFLTWAGSGYVSTQSPDQATVPGQTAAPSQGPGPGQTAAASASTGPGLLGTVGTRVTSSDPSSQESSTMRLEQARRGIDSLAVRPMGNGLGTEGSASTRAPRQNADLAPDIFVLIVALQTGIIGAVLYGLIFAAMIIWAARGPTQGRALVVAMIGIFGIASVLSATPDAPVFATTIWILILAVSAASTIDDRAVQPVLLTTVIASAGRGPARPDFGRLARTEGMARSSRKEAGEQVLRDGISGPDELSQLWRLGAQVIFPLAPARHEA